MDDDEAELFRRVQERAEERESVRIVPIAEQQGMHPIRARELARKWKNDGLANFADPNILWLTEDGMGVEHGEMQKL